MLCVKCVKNEVETDAVLGVSPYCSDCQNTLSPVTTKVPEFTSEEIKEGRLQHREDIEPAHYKGHLNKAWLEGKYGGVKRAKAMGFSEKEIKEAQYVYSGSDSYYKKYT